MNSKNINEAHNDSRFQLLYTKNIHTDQIKEQTTNLKKLYIYKYISSDIVLISLTFCH